LGQQPGTREQKCSSQGPLVLKKEKRGPGTSPQAIPNHAPGGVSTLKKNKQRYWAGQIIPQGKKKKKCPEQIMRLRGKNLSKGKKSL